MKNDCKECFEIQFLYCPAFKDWRFIIWHRSDKIIEKVGYCSKYSAKRGAERLIQKLITYSYIFREYLE